MSERELLAKTFSLTLVVLLVAGCSGTGGAPTATPTPSTQPTACVSKLTADCEAGYAEVNDITMYYEAHGEGEPLLLLHGGTAYIESYEHQIPVLAEQFHVIAPDSRAHGRTTDSDQPLSYALMADDMVALLDLLGVEKTHVVGWSDGGIIGLDLALNHPELVEKLVVYGANFSTDGLTDEFVGLIDTLEAWGAPEVYKKHAPDPAHWPDFLGKIKTMWMTQPNYTREELARVQAETLVMDGEIEEVVRREHIEEMYQSLPNAELMRIPNTGHMGPEEKPAEVNEAILEFLEE